VSIAKALIALLGSIIAAISPVLVEGDMSLTEWLNVGILAIGAVEVYNTPNIPSWPAAKAVAAALTAMLVAYTSAITLGVSAAEWVQIAIAGLSAIGVYFTPNQQPQKSTGRHARPDGT
jgi:hypothetical protein